MAGPRRRYHAGAEIGPTDPFTVALDSRLSTVEDGFDKISEGLTGLDAKFGRELRSLEDRVENTITSFAGEMRTSMSGLAGQLADRQKTPWATIGSLGGMMVVVIGAFVHQSLDPIHEDIKLLKEQHVPRVEYEARNQEALGRISHIESADRLIDQRQYDALVRDLTELRFQLRDKHQEP